MLETEDACSPAFYDPEEYQNKDTERKFICENGNVLEFPNWKTS